MAFGGGFTDPFLPITHPQAPPMPSAQHPPLTVLALTPVAWATNGSQLAMRFAMVVLGAVTVGLVGVLAREIAGDGVGLLAAGLAAVYPFLWVNDWLIMSETLTALTVVAALLLAYKLVRRPRLLTAAGLGAVCGLATLARAEVVLLAPSPGAGLLRRAHVEKVDQARAARRARDTGQRFARRERVQGGRLAHVAAAAERQLGRSGRRPAPRIRRGLEELCGEDDHFALSSRDTFGFRAARSAVQWSIRCIASLGSKGLSEGD